MFCEEERSDGVDGEGVRQVRVVELRGGFLGIENSRDREGEV